MPEELVSVDTWLHSIIKCSRTVFTVNKKHFLTIQCVSKLCKDIGKPLSWSQACTRFYSEVVKTREALVIQGLKWAARFLEFQHVTSCFSGFSVTFCLLWHLLCMFVLLSQPSPKQTCRPMFLFTSMSQAVRNADVTWSLLWSPFRVLHALLLAGWFTPTAQRLLLRNVTNTAK